MTREKQIEILMEDRCTKSEAEKLYLRLHLVTDYVSGMTDSFARDLYQEVNGIL